LAMCGNYIQRVKIVIKDNIIEQVTDFGNVWELHREGQNCDKQQYY